MKDYQPCTRRARKHAKAEASPWLNLQLSPVELGSQPLTWEQPDLMWSLLSETLPVSCLRRQLHVVLATVAYCGHWNAARGTQLASLSNSPGLHLKSFMIGG